MVRGSRCPTTSTTALRSTDVVEDEITQIFIARERAAADEAELRDFNFAFSVQHAHCEVGAGYRNAPLSRYGRKRRTRT